MCFPCFCLRCTLSQYSVDIIGDLNAFTAGWIEWNVLLDTSGGPTCIGPSETTWCVPLIGHCDAPLLADAGKQTLTFRDSYYHMGHFSRFLPRGSVRVGQQGALDTNAPVMAVSAATPAGDLVVVVLNTDEKADAAYQLRLPTLGAYAQLTVPAHGIQTLIVRGAARGVAAKAAAKAAAAKL